MDNINLLPMFFMSANSAGGLITRFNDAYDPRDGWVAFVIKGGPGTGKSTMMKRAALAFAVRGEPVELVTCTADPASLDAVIFPHRRVVIMDGTAPHVVEPRYIGACERIVDLSPAFNNKKLMKNRDGIIEAAERASSFHRRASRYLAAVGPILRENEAMAAPAADMVRAAEFAERTARENIPPYGVNGREHIRFLSGVTCRGAVFYRSTFEKMCDRTFTISDNYGTVSGTFMSTVRRVALQRGYDIITCPCPILPDEKIEHVIIPKLRLGFCTVNKFLSWEEGRKIHARRFYSAEALRPHKQRFAFAARTVRELMSAASQLMAEAKSAHDKLEEFYVPAVDFTVVDALTEKLINDIAEL